MGREPSIVHVLGAIDDHPRRPAYRTAVIDLLRRSFAGDGVADATERPPYPDREPGLLTHFSVQGPDITLSTLHMPPGNVPVVREEATGRSASKDQHAPLATQDGADQGDGGSSTPVHGVPALEGDVSISRSPADTSVIGQFPWDPFPEQVALPKGPDPIHAVIYQAAVSAADAYRGMRETLRVEADMLRVGNRFVPLERYREATFVAVGVAAGSMALAALHTLGDALTAGFVAGPLPSLEEVPFQRIEIPLGLPGAARAEEVVRGIEEVASGMSDDQLLLLLLSPGALSALALPPPGTTPEEFRGFLERARELGANGMEVDRIARTIGGGGVGGGLARLCRGADIATFVADRGEGAVLLGGGPVHPVTPIERQETRELLSRIGLLRELPRSVADRLSPGGEGASAGGPPEHRPVYIARPTDALEGAGNDLFDRKWRVRLGMLSLSAPPEEAAERFMARVEEVLDREPDPSVDKSYGIAVLAATDLGQPEGVDDGPAQGRFLQRAEQLLRRRYLSVGLLRTAGPLGASGFPGGAVIGHPTNEAFSRTPGRARAIPMEAGVTDVGSLAIALLPLVEAEPPK